MDRDMEAYLLSQYQAHYCNNTDEEALIYWEKQKHIALMNNIRDAREVRTRIMIHRQREDGHRRLWDYFADPPIFPDRLFRRRFRMQRILFNHILQGVMEYDDYFVQKPDATGRLGLSPHQKVFGAMRLLAYGASADIWGEYVCVGETTMLQTVKKFAKAIVAVFGPEFSRAPTTVDLTRIREENEPRGFPGMIGSIDCMHWEWKNCPTTWHGQYTGHKNAPTLILEAVASYDT